MDRYERLDAIFGPVAESTHCKKVNRQTLEELVMLAVEIAREGREGRKIGTMFVLGDVDAVIERSRPLILDPLYGHPGELLHVSLPDFRETVKELAQLDGAFVVAFDGTFVSAGRFIDVEAGARALPARAGHAPRRRGLDQRGHRRDPGGRLAELCRPRLRRRGGKGRDHP